MNWSDKYLAIPFEEKGRSKSGLDCWGLVCLIYKQELGVELPSFANCYQSVDACETIAGLVSDELSGGSWVKVDEPQEFDAVMFQNNQEDSHIGVYLGGGLFIHICVGQTVHVQKLNHVFWRNRISYFGRYKLK